MKKYTFKQGVIDGVPIGLGYLSVSIGFGVMAVASGLSWLNALIISMTNVTSAGQVAGVTVIATAGTLIEMAITQLIINLRYSLMGISLSQKLDGSFTTPHRLFLSAFITDEIFGVASTANTNINIKYMYGLITTPYIGWALGTFIGARASSILPESITLALGILIYGMFIAIVVPALKQNKGCIIAVAIAIAISCTIEYIPFLKAHISSGFAIIIAAVVAAGIAAFLMPIKEADDD